MSRSFIHLRRVLFGVSCAVVLGFGATQAFGAPAQASMRGSCNVYDVESCNRICGLYGMQSMCSRLGTRVSCGCYPDPIDPGT